MEISSDKDNFIKRLAEEKAKLEDQINHQDSAMLKLREEQETAIKE